MSLLIELLQVNRSNTNYEFHILKNYIRMYIIERIMDLNRNREQELIVNVVNIADMH